MDREWTEVDVRRRYKSGEHWIGHEVLTIRSFVQDQQRELTHFDDMEI